jgi:hypothetical protein
MMLNNSLGLFPPDSPCSRQGPMIWYYEHSKELSGSIQGRKFLEYLWVCHVIKKALFHGSIDT